MAAGQALRPPRLTPASVGTTERKGELHGEVRDAAGQPLSGALVSAYGSALSFELTDVRGRFTFRRLAPGAYLVRVHLDGYVSPRARYVQVDAGARQRWSVALARVPTAEAPAVLQAGVGIPVPDALVVDEEESRGENSELEWRLRHLARGVLKDAQAQVPDKAGAAPPVAAARTIGPPERSALFADLLRGQVNLLTITSFDSPLELFATGRPAPRPVAYLSLVAPAAQGDWSFRGAMTEGEISSWILAGSYARHAPATHRYEAGFSYSTQRYQGGNVEALAAMSDNSRNVGELYVSDIWTLTPQLTLVFGGRYATYDYMVDRELLSGRFTLELQPTLDDPLRFRLSVAHREIAPGAEEFVPPATGPWLPPERTFSEISRGVLTPERVDHVEVAGEREAGGGVIISVRAFRQQVGDQLVTVFGLAGVPAHVGHYYVSAGGDFESYGWGASVRRPVGPVQASVDYTQVDTQRRGTVANADLYRDVAPAVLRKKERIHDLTAAVNTRVTPTATRLMVVYKLNSAYATATDVATAARFEVQVNQEMPFLDFTGARWEMIGAVRNLFRSDLFDGSVYDELLVVGPPKRAMGGVTVRF